MYRKYIIKYCSTLKFNLKNYSNKINSLNYNGNILILKYLKYLLINNEVEL